MVMARDKGCRSFVGTKSDDDPVNTRGLTTVAQSGIANSASVLFALLRHFFFNPIRQTYSLLQFQWLLTRALINCDFHLVHSGRRKLLNQKQHFGIRAGQQRGRVGYQVHVGRKVIMRVIQTDKT